MVYLKNRIRGQFFGGLLFNLSHIKECEIDKPLKFLFFSFIVLNI